MTYAQIRAQILMMDPVPVISKIFSLVVQEERQLSIHKSVSPPTDHVFLTQHSSTVAAARGNSLLKEILMISQIAPIVTLRGTQLTDVTSFMVILLVIQNISNNSQPTGQYILLSACLLGCINASYG